MLKKIAFVGVGAGLLVTLLFGSRFPSYASTMYKNVRQQVDDSVSLEFKLEDAKNQLEKLGPEVNQMKYEFARQEMRVERLREEVAKSQENLDSQLAKILVLKNHVEASDSAFVSNGRTFTAKQVENEIKRRWDLYKTQESIVKTKAEVLDAQVAGLEAARQQIAETEGLRESLEVEIAQLEARSRLVEVAKTASELTFDDSRISRLRSSLDDIRSRLEVEEHMVNTAGGEGFVGIPLEDEVDAVGVLDEINSYLGSGSGSADLVDVSH